VEHRGRTVLAMDCVLAGAETRHGRPLNSVVRRLMRSIGYLLSIAAVSAGVAGAAESTQVTDEASAIAAAKRYTKARCTKETPCEFRARREGKQWNVMVEFPKRNNPREIAQRYPGGHVLLYFNQHGQLVRRVEGE
jgi:hypothetical protein